MKNIFKSYEDANTILTLASEFDLIGIESIICTLIDVCATKFRLDPARVADEVCMFVKKVNHENGPMVKEEV